MKIPVEEITAEPREIDFEEEVAELNRRLGTGGVQEFRVGAAIAVHMSYYRAGSDLVFVGALRSEVEGACARCLEDYRFPLEREFSFVLTPTLPAAAEVKLSREDLALSSYSGEEVDLAPLVHEQLILGLPTRGLCSETCRGLCPQCGRNRNHAWCGCTSDEGDPRLAIFRQLKVDH